MGLGGIHKDLREGSHPVRHMLAVLRMLTVRHRQAERRTLEEGYRLVPLKKCLGMQTRGRPRVGTFLVRRCRSDKLRSGRTGLDMQVLRKCWELLRLDNRRRSDK